MEEEPEGQSRDDAAGEDRGPEAKWWPWAELPDEPAAGPRDEAAGLDDTLTIAGEPEAGSGLGEAPPAEPSPVVDSTLPAAPAPPREAPLASPVTAVEASPEPEPITVKEAPPAGEATRTADPAGDAQAAESPGSLPADAPAATSVVVAGAAAEPTTTPPPADPPEPTNEAIPPVPPAVGTGKVGSIPAARARFAWAQAQASNWRLYLIRFLAAGVAVVVTVLVVPGLGFVGWRWGQFIQIALIFGILNATVKPALQFLVLRFIVSTYGIVVVFINTLLLMLLSAILDDTFTASRPVSVLLGGVVVGVLGLVLETMLGARPPVLDRDYKERNGLR